MITTTHAEKITDYAQHFIHLEFMLRVAYDACLSQNYVGARDISEQILAEAKLLKHTLTLMEENQAIAEAQRQAIRIRK